MRRLYVAVLAAISLAGCDARDPPATASIAIDPPLLSQPAAAPESAQAAQVPVIEPKAVEALKGMSSYLASLEQFEVDAQTSTDMVMDNGQKLQFGETVNYKVRRPDRFVVERESDRKHRRLVYDGSKLSLISPRMKFYSQVDAPATIQETLDLLQTRYGLEMPLEDLFRWNAVEAPVDEFREAYRVGYAELAGVETDHYAFRQEGVDWQLWIERGDRPLPRKIVITSLGVDGQPQYTADLVWNTAPAFASRVFEFSVPADAHLIAMATLQDEAAP